MNMIKRTITKFGIMHMWGKIICTWQIFNNKIRTSNMPPKYFPRN